MGIKDIRINREIDSPQVLLVSEDGSQKGVVSTYDAIRMAEEKGLDLIEVSANVNPPVCKILDYGKYRYELERHQKLARKNQTVVKLKEVRMQVKVDIGDLNTKVRFISQFLAEGNKVKVAVCGYKSDRLKTYIDKITSSNNAFNNVDIEFIENNIYHKTNNIYSLYLAKEKLLKDDTILLESDIIYDKCLINEIIRAKDENLAVVSRFESWMDGTCAVMDDNNRIIDLVDKKNFNFKSTPGYYKSVNIYKFSRNFMKKYYIPFLQTYIKTFGRNEYYEQVLSTLTPPCF